MKNNSLNVKKRVWSASRPARGRAGAPEDLLKSKKKSKKEGRFGPAQRQPPPHCRASRHG
jgi:hypothetical protein